MNKSISVAIASDHAGFSVKQQIIEYLRNEGYQYKDFGAKSEDPSDYPDFAHPVAEAVEKGEFTFGVVACGSGNGVNMVVNKHQGIRSALCWNKDVASIVRRHNDANICALPGRYVSGAEALEIVREFLNTGFESGRHQRRVDKIAVKNRPENCC
jgi:ribose 5-phosphate isomerase B